MRSWPPPGDSEAKPRVCRAGVLLPPFLLYATQSIDEILSVGEGLAPPVILVVRNIERMLKKKDQRQTPLLSAGVEPPPYVLCFVGTRRYVYITILHAGSFRLASHSTSLSEGGLTGGASPSPTTLSPDCVGSSPGGRALRIYTLSYLILTLPVFRVGISP